MEDSVTHETVEWGWDTGFDGENEFNCKDIEFTGIWI